MIVDGNDSPPMVNHDGVSMHFKRLCKITVPDWLALMGVSSSAEISVPEWDQPGVLL